MLQLLSREQRSHFSYRRDVEKKVRSGPYCDLDSTTTKRSLSSSTSVRAQWTLRDRESPVNTQRSVHEFEVFQVFAESSAVLERQWVPGQDVNILAS